MLEAEQAEDGQGDHDPSGNQPAQRADQVAGIAVGRLGQQLQREFVAERRNVLRDSFCIAQLVEPCHQCVLQRIRHTVLFGAHPLPRRRKITADDYRFDQLLDIERNSLRARQHNS